MGYKDEYYYYAFISEASYSKTPSHIIDPIRLRQNKPCFKTPMESTVQKKKTLVINLSSDFFSDNAKVRSIVESRLIALWKEGFTLYVHEKGQLKKILHNGIWFLPYEFSKLPFPNEVLTQQAIQTYGLIADEVLVLDAEKIKTLMAGDASDWLFLDPFENINLEYSKVSSASLAQLFYLHGTKIQRLNLMSCINLSAPFPEDITLSSLRQLQIGAFNEENWRSNMYRRDNNSAFSVRTLLCDSEYLEDLELGTLNISEDIFSFLKKPQALKRLDLRACQLSAVPSLDYDFSALEHLNVSHTEMQPLMLHAMLKSATQLRVLTMDHLEQFANAFKGIKCPHLEEFKAHGLKDLKELEDVFVSAKKLKKLSLEMSEKGASYDQCQKIEVPFLEELHLGLSNNRDIRYFQNIFDTAVNLRKLEMSSGRYVPETLKNKKYPLLEEWILNHSDITVDVLQSILSSTTQLRKLDLSYCKNLKGGDLTSISLPHLEVFKADHSTLDVVAVKSILEGAKGLKTLNLGNLSLDTGLDVKASALLHLEHLHIFSSKNINPLDFFNAPQLKTLGVSLCEGLSFGIDNFVPYVEFTASNYKERKPLSNIALPELKVFSVGISNINIECLACILKNSPKLKNLNLFGCTVLDGDRLHELPLQSLEDLELGKVKISAEGFKKLQKKYPNLNINNACTSPHKYSSAIFGGNDHFLQESESLDADTSPKDASFDVQKIFYTQGGQKDPEPALYRLQTFDDYGVNPKVCDIKSAFTLKNSTDLKWSKVAVTRAKKTLYKPPSKLPELTLKYYGKQTLFISEQWQALASLSPEETLTQYYTDPAVDIEIQYSKRDNLYYVRKNPGTANQKVNIEFLLDVPKKEAALPNEIEALVQKCLHFKEKALDLPKGELTGPDYLTALEQQQVGACRHRSLVFKDWMKKKFPNVPVRIVNNACHSYVEIQVGGFLGFGKKWVVRNLGGYPAALTLHEPHVPGVKEGEAAPAPVTVSLSSSGQVSGQSKNRKRYFKMQPEVVSAAVTPLAYSQSLLRPIHSQNPQKVVQKRLVQVPVHADIESVRHQVLKYCKDNHIPYFCIDSPDDLVCTSAYIERKADNTGVIHSEAGGRLYDFLHAKHARPPVLLVDYDTFTPRDMARTNTLLDKKRLVDGELLPDDMLVLGLFDPNKAGAYRGKDFYSRFDEISNCPNTTITPLPALGETPAIPGSKPIRLYGGGDWEACLLGYWALQENDLYFMEGPLLQALKNKETLFHLTGAPLENEAFQRFWHDALLTGKFEAYGQTYDLPEGFSLTQTSVCAFDKMPTLSVSDSAIPPKEALVLNPGVLNKFFGEYVCAKDTKKLSLKPSVLEAYVGKKLSIYVSDSLLLAQWARFLDACADKNIEVEFTFTPGVTVPKELPFQALESVIVPPEKWQPESPATLAYIQSDDIDFTLTSFEKGLVVDVSEMGVSEVLSKLSAKFDDKANNFVFDESESFLLQAVKETPPPKTIVLKGAFSESLRHNLSEWLFHRHMQGIEVPKIICISDEKKNLFPFLPSFTQTVGIEDKKEVLQKAFPDMQEAIEKLPLKERCLAELSAILRHLKIHPNAHIDDAWKGMHSLTLEPTPLETKLEAAIHNAEKLTEAFHKARMGAVDASLEHHPFVFLAGMTGVGKTTFVLKVLQAKYPNLHIGEDKILEWAKDKRPGKKILFIDEANISSRSWAVFEGLLRTPPHVVVDGQLIALDKDHQVVFAGNPMNYGGERQMPSLFKRHGNSVVFEPLPAAVVYQEVLLPVFEGIKIKDKPLDSKAITLPILEINAFLTSCSQTEVLITPRELAMMALLTMQYMMNHPEANPEEVARYYAYSVSHSFVPKAHQAEFQTKFGFWNNFTRDYPKQPEKLVVNDTNKAIWGALCDGLALHDLRQKSPTFNEVQKYGGLNILTVEGNPGMGKSELVIEALVVHGYKEVRLHSKEKLDSESDSDSLSESNASEDDTEDYSGQKVFYKMPANMSLAEKERLLLKASHEGAWVIGDEINSAAMMERLLNSVSMGKTLDGKFAKNAGLTIVGTQNPASFAGRDKASKALQHRSRTMVLPSEYAAHEMCDILKHKGLPQELSEDIVFDYMCCQEEAKQDSSLKAPCFRDMMEYADDVLKGVAAAPTQ
ncbi:MAG: hypothetical protein Q8R79_00095, partial [Legionellaceae bacterium]|nr:hypothetical protein [Legionellaceae bacterium]